MRNNLSSISVFVYESLLLSPLYVELPVTVKSPSMVVFPVVFIFRFTRSSVSELVYESSPVYTKLQLVVKSPFIAVLPVVKITYMVVYLYDIYIYIYS